MSPPPHDTCWTVLHAASAGDAGARSVFARSYLTPIRSYLGQRWRDAKLRTAIDDAVQDVFVECFKPDGALEGAQPQNGEFRALLYAVVRNVARRYEERAGHPGHAAGGSLHLDALPDQSDALSRVFDRAWAEAIVRDAVLRHARVARRGDHDTRQRYRVLRMRHQDDLPVREIAARLQADSTETIHNAYRRARREFRTHFRAAVAHHTGAPTDALDAECRRVTTLLGS